MEQAFVFVTVHEDGDHKDHQDDVFHEGLEIRHLHGIAEASAFRNQVVDEIKEGEEGIEDHHEEHQPGKAFYPEIEDQADADDEFHQALGDTQEKSELIGPGRSKCHKIVLDLEHEACRVHPFNNSGKDKNEADNDAADCSKCLHARPV